MKLRQVSFGLILVVCIAAIVFVVYLALEGEKSPTDNNNTTEEPAIDNETILRNFEKIFTNSINMQGNSVNNISKIDHNEELVYTINEISETKKDEYEISVKLPELNINSNVIEGYNQEIRNIFETKANSILEGTTSYTIYTVEYASFVNSNILSLVIRSTLKVGNNAQRVIVKTYNYNLSTGEEIKSTDMISIKGLATSNVNSKIKSSVMSAAKEAERLAEIGYSVYTRNVNSNMYNIENTKDFFLGENSKLYVLYPYGNSNSTSEIDIVVF